MGSKFKFTDPKPLSLGYRSCLRQQVESRVSHTAP
jgi:hypothetical protein